MIVAVSDLHLGDRASNKSGFIDFIEEYLKPNAEDISHLFLLGDILDLWRRDNSAVILDNLDILDSIKSLGFPVFYLVGNHDFIMTEMIGKYPNFVPLRKPEGNPGEITICTTHQLTNGKRKFRFIHGHQIDYWYALSFYEALCKTMCSVNESQNSPDNVWDMLLSFSMGTSAIVSSNVSQLPLEARMKIEQKLAGPLERNDMSKEESALIELNLLHQFFDIEQLIPTTSNMGMFDSIRKEARTLSSSFRKLDSAPRCIEELYQSASSGTPKEVVNLLMRSWSDTNRWILEVNRNGVEPKKSEQFIPHLRRIAAMLTVNLQSDEYLIHGHDHRGEIDDIFGVADTGCWLYDRASFITIDEGVVRLSKWNIQ
jgi:UDP-2,3-diacylglucosamine pyrophosphatase LpxH